MRLRITRALQGSIDGIQLSRLAKGQVYDVNTSLACYLLSEKLAEPAPSDESPDVPSFAKSAAERPTEMRSRVEVPRSLAADRRRPVAANGRRTRKHSKQDKA
jgi:hypothetical protein